MSTALGQKHICAFCNTKFYDLNKPKPLCPHCKKNLEEHASPDTQGKGLQSDLYSLKIDVNASDLIEDETYIEDTFELDDKQDLAHLDQPQSASMEETP